MWYMPILIQRRQAPGNYTYQVNLLSCRTQNKASPGIYVHLLNVKFFKMCPWIRRLELAIHWCFFLFFLLRTLNTHSHQMVQAHTHRLHSMKCQATLSSTRADDTAWLSAWLTQNKWSPNRKVCILLALLLW